jgi:hypothetical protein
MRARSASLSALQRAISSSVRQQPVHTPSRGLIWQTFTQGEGMGTALGFFSVQAELHRDHADQVAIGARQGE